MTLFELVAKLSLDSSEYEKGLTGAKSKISTFGTAVKGGLVKTAKIGAAAIAGIGTATVATGAVITKATGKVAEYGDNIDKMSQKMGLSAEKYQEWDAILQHSGSSIEAMKGGMKTLANAVQKGAKEFERLGLTQEQIASMSQEELFEATIAGLQKVENTTERTYLAGKLLGRGATELGALLNTSAEDTEKMRQRVHALGGIMSDEAVKASAQYQDSLQDLKTAIQGVTRGTVSEFLPSMVKIMDGLTSIFANEKGGVGKVTEGINGIIETVEKSAPKLFTVIGSVGSALFNAISQNLPKITDNIMKFSIKAVDGLIDASPKIIEASFKILSSIITSLIQKGPTLIAKIAEAYPKLLKQIIDGFSNIKLDLSFVDKLAEGIKTGIPKLLEQVMPLLVQFTEAIRNNAGKLIDAGLTLVLAIGKGLMDSLPVLIETIPQIVINIAGIINDNAPKLIIAGVKLIGMIIVGIIKAIPTLIKNIPKIFEAIVAVWSAINWLSLGTKVINIIKNGFLMLKAELPNALANIGKNAINAVKSLNWKNLGTTVVKLLASGAKSVGSFIISALKFVAKAGINAVKNINWFSVGKAIVKGIAAGIFGVPGIIANALLKVAKSGYEKVKSFLGIQSPSKLFRKEIGENIGKGLALGIEDTIPNVMSAMDELDNSLSTPSFEPLSINVKDESPATAYDVINAMDKLETRNASDVRQPIYLEAVINLGGTEVAKKIYELYNNEKDRLGNNLAGGFA